MTNIPKVCRGGEMPSKQMTGCFQAEEQLLVSTAVVPKRRVCWNIKCSSISFSSSSLPVSKGHQVKWPKLKESRFAWEVGKKFSTVRVVRPWHKGCVEWGPCQNLMREVDAPSQNNVEQEAQCSNSPPKAAIPCLWESRGRSQTLGELPELVQMRGRINYISSQQ